MCSEIYIIFSMAQYVHSEKRWAWRAVANEVMIWEKETFWCEKEKWDSMVRQESFVATSTVVQARKGFTHFFPILPLFSPQSHTFSTYFKKKFKITKC